MHLDHFTTQTCQNRESGIVFGVTKLFGVTNEKTGLTPTYSGRMEKLCTVNWKRMFKA